MMKIEFMKQKNYLLAIIVLLCVSCKGDINTDSLTEETQKYSIISYTNIIDAKKISKKHYKHFSIETEIIEKERGAVLNTGDTITQYVYYELPSIKQKTENVILEQINKNLHENSWDVCGNWGWLAGAIWRIDNEFYGASGDDAELLVCSYSCYYNQSSSIEINNKILSQIIEVWDCKYGYAYTYCYRLDNGEKLILTDLFEDIHKAEYLAIIKYGKYGAYEDLTIDEYTSDSFSKEYLFYFTEKFMVFVYSTGDYGCIADGIIRIEVPLSEIKQYLKPEIRELLNK